MSRAWSDMEQATLEKFWAKAVEKYGARLEWPDGTPATLDEIERYADEVLDWCAEGDDITSVDAPSALAEAMLLPCRVRVTFETWTPEDIEAGDTDDRGWEDEEGRWFATPELAAAWVWREGGRVEGSARWATYDEEVDSRTGERTNYGYHPVAANGGDSVEVMERFLAEMKWLQRRK